MRIGFQTRILLPVILILCCLLGGTLVLVNQHVREGFHSETSTSLEIAKGVLKNSYDIRLNQLILRFRGVPNEPRFKAVCQLRDPATMRALLKELLQEHQAGIALFVSSDDAFTESASLLPEPLCASLPSAACSESCSVC